MWRLSFVFALAALLVLLVTMGLVACGTAPGSPGDDGSGSTSTTAPDSTSTTAPDSTSTSTPASSSTTLPTGSIAHPTGASEVVLRVVTGGGFVPIQYNYTMVPEFTLYGDGRIIAPGPTTMQYPGAALPNLQTAKVSEDVIQEMLAAAKEAQLFRNGVDYGQPGVTDVGTTTITINAGGTTYKSAVYALGFDSAGGSGLTMQQQQERAAANDFRTKLTDPANFSAPQPAWEAYDFTALKVFSQAIDTTAETASTEVRPNHLPWPLADLATSGTAVENTQGLRQLVLSGDDLATIKPLLQQATEITIWESGAAKYDLWLRPLLPDEAAAL